jgi:hypothetical protein
VRFPVLTAATTKKNVFWDVETYCLRELHRRFRGAHCLHHGSDAMMEAVITYETSINFYRTTWCNIMETVIWFISD